jgi:hypothetical protein
MSGNQRMIGGLEAQKVALHLDQTHCVVGRTVSELVAMRI